MTGTFGDVLSEARITRQLSQSRLAQEAGFDHSYISRLEAGKRMPSRAAVLTLAEVMTLARTDLDRLLVAAGYRPTDDSNLIADEPALAEALRLLRDPRLPETTRASFRQMMSLLVQQLSAAVAA